MLERNIPKKIIITRGPGYIGFELCKICSGESWNNEITVISKNFFFERVNQLSKIRSTAIDGTQNV